MIPPPPKGSVYTSQNSKNMVRQFAIAGLLNILRKIGHLPEHDLPLRVKNIREDANRLLIEIRVHTGTWTTEWAHELTQIIQAARRASILIDSNGEDDE